MLDGYRIMLTPFHHAICDSIESIFSFDIFQIFLSAAEISNFRNVLLNLIKCLRVKELIFE